MASKVTSPVTAQRLVDTVDKVATNREDKVATVPEDTVVDVNKADKPATPAVVTDTCPVRYSYHIDQTIVLT